MKDPSVLDVQRHLRKHADWGHDVTQHPRETIIRDKPYAARLGAVLRLNDDSDISTLSSKLMQSESPVLTSVATRVGTESQEDAYKGYIFKSLYITSSYPTVDTDKHEGDHHFFSASHSWKDRERHSYTQENVFKDGKLDPRRRQTFSNEKDVHDVLNRIATDKHKHFGSYISWDKDHYEETPIKHEQRHVFDLKKALTREYPDTPLMSGLIVVHSPGYKGDGEFIRRHVYDPKTEQLTKLVDYE